MNDKLVWTIFHEFAHCVKNHKDSDPRKPHSEQEQEAKKVGDQWFEKWKQKGEIISWA